MRFSVKKRFKKMLFRLGRSRVSQPETRPQHA